jgi:hypothetical protein
MIAPENRQAVVGNAQGFWGDDPRAPERLVRQRPDLGYLTLDYLAEVSMSILARQRDRDPGLGYARDFVGTVASLAPHLSAGHGLRLIANAGGLNPRGCAERCAAALREAGCRRLRIAIVTGDDVLPAIREAAASGAREPDFDDLDTGRPIADVADRLVTANAYLGAAPIVDALRAGAVVVITGRVADPSLTVAACAFHHGWSGDDRDRIAGATVAGHLIECGVQATGGISTDWLDVPDPGHLGYPVVEVDAGGTFVLTKPEGTGGRVSEETVKEQILYEIGDPGRYLSPDVTASLLGVTVEDLGGDRVRVSGATGRPAPGTLKVSATYRAGWRAAGTLTICGRRVREKAERCGRIVLDRLAELGARPRESTIECLGAGAVIAGGGGGEPLEVVLRIAVADDRRDAVDLFASEFMPLVTAGPQGTTGYAEGRPRVHEVFGYWPCRIARDRVMPVFEVIES